MFPDRLTHDMRRRFAKEAEFAIARRTSFPLLFFVCNTIIPAK